MAPKLSSRQQAQLAYLKLLPPKFQRIYSVVEQLALPRVDETLMRALGRLVDDIKGNAASLSMAGLAETAGRMGMVVRGGGGMPTKVRGLRELQGSLKINYDAAMRSATTPGALGEEEPSAGSSAGLGRPAAPLGEKPVDERSSHQDDHEMDQHADEQGHVGERPQDEPGTNGCEKDSKPMTSNRLRKRISRP